MLLWKDETMSRGDEPAYPTITIEPVPPGERGYPKKVLRGGLTKRERFAMVAMQGMVGGIPLCDQDPSLIAECAYRQADAMLAEMERGDAKDAQLAELHGQRAALHERGSR